MDPVTAAIIAATAVKSTASKDVIINAYKTLKVLLEQKFGSESEVVKSVEVLEARPESVARKNMLQEVVITAKADQDPDTLRAAQELLKQISMQPSGTQHIQQAIGSYIVQTDRGSTASITLNQSLQSKSNV